MTQLPTAILLDLDNCLYEYSVAHDAALKNSLGQLSSLVGVPANDLKDLYLRARADVKSRLGTTASSHSRLLYFKRSLEMMGLGARSDLAFELEAIYWGQFLRNMVISDGVVNFLELARERGIPMFIVTDMTLQIQIRKLLVLGLLSFFSGILSSEEVGSDKPSVGFSELIVSRFNPDLQATWVIGDDEEKDGGLAKIMGALFLVVPKPQSRLKFFTALSQKLRL